MDLGKCVWSDGGLCDWRAMEPGRSRCREAAHVSRGIRLAVAVLSWTSWAAGHWFLSACFSTLRSPVGHPGRLPKENAAPRSYNMRRWMQAKLRQASVACSSTFADGSDGQLACGLTTLPIAAGRHHTCAIRANGQLVCFGDSSNRQCHVPPDLGPVLAIAAGSFHT